MQGNEKQRKNVLINFWRKRELGSEIREENLNNGLRNATDIRKMKD